MLPSGLICMKFIININSGMIIILDTLPRYTEELNNIKRYPKHIGLREYLLILFVIRKVLFCGLRRFIVVFAFVKKST